MKKIALKTPLIGLVPEYTGAFREAITVFHLLTQSLSFPFSLSSIADQSPEEILSRIYSSNLSHPPGFMYQYANATSILLGIFLERATGKKFDTLAEEYFFTPLGMRASTFFPSTLGVKNIAPTEGFNGQVLTGVVHDESARRLSSLRVVGSAGLFSTAGDLLVFLQMLLQGGKYAGARLFHQETIDIMAQAVSLSDGERVGLGWEMFSPWMGLEHSGQTIGKTGFTGCFVLCDMQKGIGIVHLSNHVYPKRTADRNVLRAFRSQLVDRVISSLEG